MERRRNHRGRGMSGSYTYAGKHPAKNERFGIHGIPKRKKCAYDISKMDSLLQQLQSEWEGSASESYAARYQELKPGFMKAEELIREIAQALDSTARIVEETDSDIANQFKA